MAVINEVRRNLPPMPDPRDTDQARINRQTIDVMKHLISLLRQVDAEKRLASLEEIVNRHEDQILKLIRP